jgi:hypothetical protein
MEKDALMKLISRDLLDHAFLRSVAKTSAVDFRVPPTKVLELGCGVCFFLSPPSSLSTISSTGDLISRVIGSSTLQRSGRSANSCV